MATSEIRVCSNALLLIGDNAISTYAETRGGVIAGALVDSTIEDMLSQHLWHFARAQLDLSRLSTGADTDTGYTYRFQLPAGYIRAVQVWPRVPYEVVGDKVHANVTELRMEYVYRPDAGAWPPWFVKLMEYQMAATLANPVTENNDLSKFWEAKARDQLSVAMSIDAQQRPNVAIAHNPFLEEHY